MAESYRLEFNCRKYHDKTIFSAAKEMAFGLRQLGRRYPWDERLPDGSSPSDLFDRTRPLPTPNTNPLDNALQSFRYRSAPMQGQYRDDNPNEDPRVMALPIGNGQYGERMVRPDNTGAGLITGFGDERDYQPLASVNPSSTPLEVRRSAGTETRPWKVGGSLETDPLKRDAARIRAMIENPTADVSPSGSVAPPHPFSRKKAALLGALYGLGMAGQSGNLAAGLSGAATGAGIGIANPRSIQEWRRRMEVEDAQKQLAVQQKMASGQLDLETGRAQLEHIRAQTEAAKQGKHQYIERSDGVYEISPEYPNGRRVGNIPPEVKGKSAGTKHYFERDDGVYVADDDHPEGIKLSGVPGKPAAAGKETYDVTLPDGTVVKATAGEAINAAGSLGKNKGAKAAKLKEIENVKSSAEIAEGNADTNEQLANAEPKVVDPITGEESESPRAKELRDRAKEFRKTATEARGKIPGLQAEADAVPEDMPTPRGRAIAAADPLKGKKWSKSKYHGARPVAEAAAEAARRGAIVVP